MGLHQQLGHLGTPNDPNLGTSLQGAGAERTCLISAICGDTCASFRHIHLLSRDYSMRSRCQRGAKSAVFVSPFVFSGHRLLQKNANKERPMSENKGFPWIPQQNFLKVHILVGSFRFGDLPPRSKSLSLIGKLRKPARWRNEVKPIHPLI